MTDALQMPSPPPASGTIAYGARAAMQDISLAMGRDVVRALVEMVTNASDSYARLERRGIAVDGIIDVFAERLRSGEHNRIIVRDHAEGMRRHEVVVRILRAGERTSEAGDRGVQGRGAKDISFFGKARYESIREGSYAHVIIDGGLQPCRRSSRCTRPTTGTPTMPITWEVACWPTRCSAGARTCTR